jgi:hypothetical protein
MLVALKSLVLKGCIVTADALHCHPRMAAQGRRRDAHYAPTTCRRPNLAAGGDSSGSGPGGTMKPWTKAGLRTARPSMGGNCGTSFGGIHRLGFAA